MEQLQEFGVGRPKGLLKVTKATKKYDLFGDRCLSDQAARSFPSFLR